MQPATLAMRPARGGEAMIVAELMTRDPVTVASEASIARVWSLMRDLDIRHVPVVDRGALVGMVSDRDIAHLDLTALLRLEGALQDELARPVAHAMSGEVICVEADCGLARAIALLIEHKVGALPVVRRGTRELVGILSYVDVLRAYQESLAGE
jgi:acetoin utilization protein AcuB